MKHNVSEVADLHPDFLGFIFYRQSPRNFTGTIPNIPDEIQKVGVFVNEEIDVLIELSRAYDIDIIQLHGDETVEYCENLQTALKKENMTKICIWKVFRVSDSFDFDSPGPYETCASAFLFDTGGKNYGGNGFPFNWELLYEYKARLPIILSGGIGLEEVPRIRELLAKGLPIMAIDVNSRFETEPGRKEIVKLKRFIHELSC